MTFQVTSGNWTCHCLANGLPELLCDYQDNAVLSENFELKSEGSVCFLAARSASAEWPELVVTQRYEPGPSSGFSPGALISPEDVLFVGAGTRLLCYDLTACRRKWKDCTEVGFWSWEQHSDFVVMAAELEMAVWSSSGQKRWSRFVEPPWSYRIQEGHVTLDVMGNLERFSLAGGPSDADRSV